MHSALTHQVEIFMDSYSSASAEIKSQSLLAFTTYATEVFYYALNAFGLKTRAGDTF